MCTHTLCVYIYICIYILARDILAKLIHFHIENICMHICVRTPYAYILICMYIFGHCWHVTYIHIYIQTCGVCTYVNTYIFSMKDVWVSLECHVSTMPKNVYTYMTRDVLEKLIHFHREYICMHICVHTPYAYIYTCIYIFGHCWHVTF